MVADLDTGTVDYIADERRQASLDGYFEKFTPEQLAASRRSRWTCGSRSPTRCART